MKASRIIPVLSILAISTLCSAITATTTSITSSLNPSIYGQTVTFTATVTSSQGAPPNGEVVTFKQGINTLGTSTLSNGSAQFSISTLTVGGTDNVKAIYAGDANFSTSTSAAVAQVVTAATTTTKVLSSQNPINVGQSVTFTATVSPQFSGTVTGNVAFYNGTAKLGQSALSGGVAKFTSATLTGGTDSITAVFKGTNTFLTSTSPALNQIIGVGNTYNLTMVFDGVTRYYQVFVPTVLSPNPPLLLMLHGTRFDVLPANPSMVNWGWQPLANQNEFILVQPASTLNANTGQWNWNAYFMNAAFTSAEVGTCTTPPATACPDDAGFLRQLITNLIAQYSIDPNQVYVTGMSSGGQMAERVGVELSDIVAAIAPTSGQMVGQQVPPPGLPGTAAAPISVQEWHGTTDTILPPCSNGTTKYSSVVYTLDTVDDTFNYWVQQNNCNTLQTTQPLCTNGQATQGLSGNIATGCAGNNIEVQFIWEVGIGHSWLTKYNAARWQFLSAHPKQSAK